jgi:two-component system sensor histidine kinase AlgZ
MKLERMGMSKPTDRRGIEMLERCFLPNFCDVRMVFGVVVIAELLALIITLVGPGVLEDPWGKLGMISVYMQWIALTSAAVLCFTRPLLSRLGNTAAAIVSYLLVLLVTAGVSELAFLLLTKGQLIPYIITDDHAVFLLRSLFISAVISAIVLRYIYVQFQWREQLKTEASARVQALQARIRPHFLFNSLNTIASLTRSDPELAETAIEDLSDLFRASLDNSHDQATLGDEVTIARRYLNIESLRLGDRLSVAWDLDDLSLETRVPPLILQPLLENAIYHGIEPLPEGGIIHVAGHNHDGNLEIVISNPVAGASMRKTGTRIAQENIRQRLQLAFGAHADLVTSQSAGVYTVTLKMPGAGKQ